ncbi:MAG: Gx transporter family protein [Clostridia bacterium]|nr:Gx transporter family protein [Clostridia bacterium]
MQKTKKITVLGVLAALSIVLSFVETLLPPIYAAIPGIKIGLANIVNIFLLYKFSIKDTAAVTLVRVLTVAFLFGNLMTLAYSIAGAFLSITIMALLKKTNRFSTVGVSIAGGVAHNLGQIAVAIIVTSTLEIGYYMIFLCISGIISGTLIGIAGALVLKYTKNLNYKG